jgi:hypothetical protein
MEYNMVLRVGAFGLVTTRERGLAALVLLVALVGSCAGALAGAGSARQWLELEEGCTPGSLPQKDVGWVDIDSTVFDLKMGGVFLEDVQTEQGSFRLAKVPVTCPQ